MVGVFIGSSIGIVSANFIYAAFCSQPNWAEATERSWFQFVALIGVGAALAIRGIMA
jgi:hypothetical protein